MPYPWANYTDTNSSRLTDEGFEDFGLVLKYTDTMINYNSAQFSK
jgi:hypothetical protein